MRNIEPDYSLYSERVIELPLLKTYCLKQKEKGLTRVFDIGGAESLYLGWLLENGFEVTVLDPCKWGVNQNYLDYIDNPKFHAIKEGIEDFIVTPEKTDFALLISVLEHLGRGGYASKKFVQPEVTCFKNIQVPFCFTTPAGLYHEIGNPPDRNYSEEVLLDLLKEANKEVLFVEYRKAPTWEVLPYEKIKDLRYGQIQIGASAIAYCEIE